jgi:outer membrane protein TolC
MKARSLLAVVALGLASPGAGAETLSRSEAVARALAVNPDVKRSLEDLARLEGIIQTAKADALPELTLQGSALRYRDPSLLNSSSFDSFPPDLRESLKPTPANLYEGLAVLRQTLFSFKVGAALRAARFGRSYGEEELRRARQLVALLAVQVYNQYLLSRERVRIEETAVREKEQELEISRNRRVAGVATDLDVLRLQVNLENARAQLLRVRGAADLARGNLNAVMVRPIDSVVNPSDVLEFLPLEVTIDDAVQQAWENRPEAKAVALNEKIRAQLITVAAGEGRPSLELDATYGWSVRQPSNFFNSDYTKWNLGLVLKVPLFDGFRTAGKVAQARAELAKVTQDRIALENQIRLEAKDAVDRLAVAKSVLQAADLNVIQARKALDMTRANYGLGAASTLDVLEAQAALTLAESNRVEALYAHANARASLRYVMARDPLDPPAGGEP